VEDERAPDGSNPFIKLLGGVSGVGSAYITATTLSMLLDAL
jgi:2-phosphoglycerate kinase